MINRPYLHTLGLSLEQNPLNKGLMVFSIVITLMFTAINAQAAVTDAFDRPAVSTQLGPHSFLLGAAQVAQRLVLVGERGIILLSDDQGNSWKQAAVPVSVTLTAVRFADDLHGFAIGHAGTVLTTDDAGESWKLRLDGRRIAEIMLSAAKKGGDERAIASAQRLVSDGPDKPLLDLLVLDANQVIVIGAYGIALMTQDGGQSWTSWTDRIDNPGALHLYSIRKAAQRMLIAGEMGMVWLSNDEGASFELLETPYEGSFFTAELPDQNTIVLAGLRGNVWRSDDNGSDWYQLKNPVTATITASLIDQKGELVMVNQAGMILKSHNKSIVPLSMKSLPPLNNIIQKANGEFLVLSMRGSISVNPGAMK